MNTNDENQLIELVEPETNDSSIDQSELATLAGFEPEPEPNPTDNPIDQSELFEPIQDPHTVKTQPTLAGNPFAKAGLVGVALMVVFGIGGFFAAQLAGVDIKKAPSLVKEKPPETTQLVKKAEAKEVGELKTQLAIASQERQLKAVEESKKPRVSAKPTPKPESESTPKSTPPPSPPRSPSPSPSPPPSPPSPPRKVVYTPPPKRVTPPPPPPTVNTERLVSSGVEISRSVQPLPQPLPKPPPLSVREPPPEPEPITEPKTEADWQTFDFAQVQTLAMIGSYGGNTDITATSPNLITQTHVNTGSSVIFQTGQMASAETVTPVICIPDQRFIAQLTEPMTSSNGWELLPTGTQIIMSCESVEENGMVVLNASTILQEGTEYPIKEGAISIRGEAGQPLIAQSWNNNRREIAKRDRTLFIIGALSKVGEILNEPESQSSVVTNGGTSQTSNTVTSSDPDILGAILEGGFEPLTDQFAARNEQQLDALLNQETIWYIPAQAQLQIFVNQSFSL